MQSGFIEPSFATRKSPGRGPVREATSGRPMYIKHKSQAERYMNRARGGGTKAGTARLALIDKSPTRP